MWYKNDNINPIDHEIDLESLHHMEKVSPMTSDERKSLRNWVYQGNSPDENPWHHMDKDGYPMNYLEAYRHHHGYALEFRYIII
jgi:hypothetical protein